MKYLIILALLLYVVYKICMFFFRAGAASQQFRDPGARRNFEGAASDKQKRDGNGAKGGEYIDFEEVK